MSVDAQTVRRIAHLARIAVADDEIPHLQAELNAILAFVEQLAAVDVAKAVAAAAVSDPVNRISEVGGPQAYTLPDLIRIALTAHGDPREVIADPKARYYGVTVSDNTLVPDHGARLGEMRFENWLSQSAPQVPAANRQPASGMGAAKNV